MQTDKKENDERQPVILFADDDTLCLDVGVKNSSEIGLHCLGSTGWTRGD